ncbi:Integrase catalytic domain-containing protein [Alteromonas macleodii]
MLDQLKAERELPTQLSTDNFLALISVTLKARCETNSTELVYIKPNKPQQNGFVERFKFSCRRESLYVQWFENLSSTLCTEQNVIC